VFVALALPEVASAWNFSVSGSASCDAQAGEYVVSWTVDNSGEDEDFTITASDRGAVPTGSTVSAYGSGSFSEHLPGSTSGDVSLTVSGNWPSDLGGQTNSASVSLAGDCAPPPVDVCPNIEGVQTTIPPGMIKDANGNCVVAAPPTMSDDCPNLPGIQGSVPEGMIKDANGDCVPRPTAPPPPTDVCLNLAGVQTDVPSGMTKDASGNCVTPAAATTPASQAAATTPTTTPTPAAPATTPQPVNTAQPVKSGVKAKVKTKRAKKHKATAKTKSKQKAKAKGRGGTLPVTK
jgi:hypothetical protein